MVIDAFRMIPDGGGMMGMMMPTNQEPRQTTSNIGFLKKPTIQAQIHGLNRYYYSLVVDWRKNDLEEQMLYVNMLSELCYMFRAVTSTLYCSCHNPYLVVH